MTAVMTVRGAQAAGSAAPAADSAPAIAPGAAEPVAATAHRLVWRPVEIEPVSGVAPGVRGRRIAVLGDDPDLAAELVRQLAAAGAVPVRITPEHDLPAEIALDGIVDLGLGGTADDGQPERSRWLPRFLQTLHLLQACAADWAAEPSTDRLGYVPVTRTGGQLGAGDEPVRNPLAGLWIGLAKGLPRELPNLNIRVVDLPAEADPGAAAALVCAELYRWGLFEVAHRGGRRYTLRAEVAPAGPVARTFGPDDVMLMSGGGRGIGFQLARDFARRYGSTVIVTGRAPLPDRNRAELRASTEAFERLRAEGLRAAARTASVPTARREFDALARERDLLANLDRAAAEGLRIEYRSCDVTDPDAVTALVASCGDRLVGVVHDAGIDRPARLAAKSDATVAQVIGVKVDGFCHLWHATQHLELGFFCSVGSLTGRWGGMVGQLDYGAANEALSYLGRWAQHQAAPSTSVRTLCWPTWERLGMISNYQATLRYMAALDVAEGVALWQAELSGAGSGEVTFIGEVGTALTPLLVRGYQPSRDLPRVEQLGSAAALLGRPVSYVPGQQATSVSPLLLPGWSRGELLLDGEPAAPVAICLEHLIATAGWVQQGTDLAEPTELLNTWIDLDALRSCAALPAPLVLKTAVRVGGDRRSSDVHSRLQLGDRLVAESTVRFAAQLPTSDETSILTPTLVTPGVVTPRADAPAAVAGRLDWTGRTLDLTPPSGGAVAADRVADFCGSGPSIRPVLGLNAVESLVRACYLAAGAPAAHRFELASLRRTAQIGAIRSEVRASTSQWSAADADGRTWLRGDGARFRSSPSPDDDRKELS